MVFFELRWNYSPLKEKAVLLPDGLFILLVALRQTAKESCCAKNHFLMQAARHATGLATFFFCRFAPHRHSAFLFLKSCCSSCKPLGTQVGLAASRYGQNLSRSRLLERFVA